MRTKNLKSILVFSALAMTLSACSMEASISSLVENFTNFKPSKGGEGLTSGSGQMQKVTSGAYKVSSSVGVVTGTNTVNNSLYHQTAGGYKVYNTVQGAIVSQ
ncbi:MAG: hypothetical protein ACXVCP_19545 [Bdellovibrio sp.]